MRMVKVENLNDWRVVPEGIRDPYEGVFLVTELVPDRLYGAKVVAPKKNQFLFMSEYDALLDSISEDFALADFKRKELSKRFKLAGIGGGECFPNRSSWYIEEFTSRPDKLFEYFSIQENQFGGRSYSSDDISLADMDSLVSKKCGEDFYPAFSNSFYEEEIWDSKYISALRNCLDKGCGGLPADVAPLLSGGLCLFGLFLASQNVGSHADTGTLGFRMAVPSPCPEPELEFELIRSRLAVIRCLGWPLFADGLGQAKLRFLGEVNRKPENRIYPVDADVMNIIGLLDEVASEIEEKYPVIGYRA